ncbi:hypothetical protein, partial [Morganella morganii]|uniref:hypothetical protein n=1 Tax=Morganella morganii TaxID=582 RepID=UPI000BCC8D0D
IVAIPILMGFWIRGRIPAESSNPLNRFLIRIYHPLLLNRGDPDPDGLLDPRQDPGGEQQSAESLFDPHLS